MISAEFPQTPPRGTTFPSASIVIPVHNKSIITRHCLDALLTEPDDDIEREIIVVDDGSSDITPSMLAEYGSRIRVIRNEAALGFAGACNAGAAAARNEFIVLLNNDTIPTGGWLANLVAHAVAHPEAAVVGVKLLFPNDTVQHAGVVFGLDLLPHHIYIGFPASHPATMISRRYQVVTAACALFRRKPWTELAGLDTTYRNGWEDVDYCLRAGEAGYEIHYCAESVLYHLESATRDLLSAAERANQEVFRERWQGKIVPDDFGYYWMDGLLSAHYGARYPIQLSISPLLAGVSGGENDRIADRILYDRARQVMILLRNNIVLNVRVQEAEARVADAERRLSDALMKLATSVHASTEDISSLEPEPSSDVSAKPEAGLPEAHANQPTLPHRIVGMVESPGRIPDVITDGILIVSGWTLAERGGVRIEAIINGSSRGDIPYGDSRPDAAALYPGYPAAEHCGFWGEIGVQDLPDGMHELTVRISDAEDGQAELTTTFEIDHHAFETGRVIGRLDLPVRGSLYIPREIIVVSGWVLAPSGVRALDVRIDGESRGRVDYGALRPDIAKRRRQYADADHCGFSGTVPLFGLDEGSHELVVHITANDGQALELPTRIEIDRTLSIDGGVPVINRQYPGWLELRRNGLTSPPEFEQSGQPCQFGVVVSLSGDQHDALEALAASVHAQSHSAWRMALIDRGDASSATQTLARQLAVDDVRISFSEASGSGATADLNSAMARLAANWVLTATPGIILSPSAFARTAQALAGEPDAVVVYSDDDRVDPNTTERWNPFFKPDWSPDLHLAMNYLGPFTLVRRDAAVAAGGLRDGLSGAEVYDLALRLTDASRRVLHVPDVLATTIERAPAPGEPWLTSDWRDEERRAIADALQRRGDVGAVEFGIRSGTWRVRYAMPRPSGVTAVIPTGGNLALLRPCLDDLLYRTHYPNLDILLVDNSHDEAVEHLVAELCGSHPNVRRIVEPRTPFNYSALINAALPHVENPLLLMLNDDITVIDPDWLRAMAEHAQRPEVGIVGAKLLYPDGTIQHAGVILGPFGGSVHVFKRSPGDDPGFFNLPDVVRNVSAVTFACALIDRAVFDTIGGLDEINLPVAFNDTDFCLRARDAGFEVLYTPHAALYHHESVTKTVIAHPHEIEFLRERWGHVIAHDPYYNPNLTRHGDDARLNMEPAGVG